MNQVLRTRDWLAERSFGFLGFSLGIAILVGVVSHQNARLDRIEKRTTKVEHRTTIVERRVSQEFFCVGLDAEKCKSLVRGIRNLGAPAVKTAPVVTRRVIHGGGGGGGSGGSPSGPRPAPAHKPQAGGGGNSGGGGGSPTPADPVKQIVQTVEQIAKPLLPSVPQVPIPSVPGR